MTTTRSALPAVTEGQRGFIALKKQYGLYSGGEVGQIVRDLPSAAYIVEGLIPHCSINILVGDSGVGKTALGYQLALAVASGTPFLTFPVKKKKVLLVDYENAIWDCHWILEQQRKYLGLAGYPQTLLLWPFHPLHPEGAVEEAILRLRPQLVILDSLRSYCPEMERDNSLAGRQIRKLRQVTRNCGAAILLMHHVHKRRSAGAGCLEEGQPLEWLLRAAGSRALINQTDVRLALARRNPRHNSGDEEILVLRGQARTRGEIGPFYLRRRSDAEGEPLGYERSFADPSQLNNPDQEAAYHRLPQWFWFREARFLYGKQGHATKLFLDKLINLGLASKVAHGQYRKYENHRNATVLQ